MKLDWKKQEKEIYIPKKIPDVIEIPNMNYYTLEGSGNPNGDEFELAVSALYSMAYGVKMSPKKGLEPEGYIDYTVYPLEGFWSFDTIGNKEHNLNNTINKDHLNYKIMIRQPDFVTEEYAIETINRISETKPNPNNSKIKFETIREGLSVQLLHIGSYDTEPESFKILDNFCIGKNLERINTTHKELYLTNAKKSAPENNKTVLRYNVKQL